MPKEPEAGRMKQKRYFLPLRLGYGLLLFEKSTHTELGR